MLRMRPRWLIAALTACLLAGLLRLLAVLAHQPLIALANSYDEVRYSACFDLYPLRAHGKPDDNSPAAPYARYTFVATPEPMCYWSSELIFQGAATLVYRIEHATRGSNDYSVRWLGALKIAALLILWSAFTLAWLRRGEPWHALANAVMLPLLFADPANTIYLNTFYAEWTALLCAYATLGVIVLFDSQPRTTLRFVLVTLAALALGASKIQHLLLPLACAFPVAVIGLCRSRRMPWQAGALLLGACLALTLQLLQLQRDSEAIRAINVFNHADVVFTGLLPNASDPAATMRELELGPECQPLIGLRAWQMPDFPAASCPQLLQVTRAAEVTVLLRDPAMLLRLLWHGMLALNPWLAPGLGTVEGGTFAPLPQDFFTFSRALSEQPVLRCLLFGGPIFGGVCLLFLATCKRRHRFDAGGFGAHGALLATAVVVAVMFGTLIVVLVGDGLADTPKQGHLIFNAALAWWIVALVSATARLAAKRSGQSQDA